MQPTSKIRVSSDRIPRVLVFVYFCRLLSGNMEERPTRRVYIEILMCVPIFYHLEDSRSHGNERARMHDMHMNAPAIPRSNPCGCVLTPFLDTYPETSRV